MGGKSKANVNLISRGKCKVIMIARYSRIVGIKMIEIGANLLSMFLSTLTKFKTNEKRSKY